MFFGPVAVLGTDPDAERAAQRARGRERLGVGMLTCAVLVANNLRDIPTDETVGKRTLAVLLGDRDTRRLYAALVLLPFLLTVLAGLRSWPMLLACWRRCWRACCPCGRCCAGADGRALIRVLGQTGLLLLAWSVLTGVGLALGGARLSGRWHAVRARRRRARPARSAVVAPQPRPQHLALRRPPLPHRRQTGVQPPAQARAGAPSTAAARRSAR